MISYLPLAAIAAAAFALVLLVFVWRAWRRSRIDWSGLIVDDATGKASHTKLWAHVANAAMTVLVIRIGWNATAGDGVVSLFVAYGGIVAGSQLASKLIGARFGGGAPAAGTVTTETKLEEKKTTVERAPGPAASPESAANPQGRST